MLLLHYFLVHAWRAALKSRPIPIARESGLAAPKPRSIPIPPRESGSPLRLSFPLPPTSPISPPDDHLSRWLADAAVSSAAGCPRTSTGPTAHLHALSATPSSHSSRRRRRRAHPALPAADAEAPVASRAAAGSTSSAMVTRSRTAASSPALSAPSRRPGLQPRRRCTRRGMAGTHRPRFCTMALFHFRSFISFLVLCLHCIDLVCCLLRIWDSRPVVCLHVTRRLARWGGDQVDDDGSGVYNNERPLQRLPCGIN